MPTIAIVDIVLIKKSQPLTIYRRSLTKNFSTNRRLVGRDIFNFATVRSKNFQFRQLSGRKNNHLATVRSRDFQKSLKSVEPIFGSDLVPCRQLVASMSKLVSDC